MSETRRRLQCKDIPDRPILEFLAHLEATADLEPDTWANWCWDDDPRCVRHAMPPGLDDRLVLAKMAMLIRRGLVDGCTCGCRGDFVITDKGLAWLAGDPGKIRTGKNPAQASLIEGTTE